MKNFKFDSKDYDLIEESNGNQVWQKKKKD